MLLFVSFVWLAAVSAETPGSSPTGPYVPPKCGQNEYFELCSFKCPSQSCHTDPKTPCDPGDGCCRNECRCNEGYLRNKKGLCVRACECAGPNPARCTPTCKVPNPPSCSRITNFYNCRTGSIWDDDKGECVLIENCPYGVGCNGDPLAHIRTRPPPCPSTCSAPDESPCKKLGPAYGCVCNSGYILTEVGGQCRDPNKCPGGNPCGRNQTFIPCKYDCPSEFCPLNDRGGQVFCTPATCRSGCVCERRFVWISKEDRRCILSQECDEIECTRKNEQYDRCPSACFTDGCNEPDPETTPCNTLLEPECYPQCRCKPGFARESVNNLCIPKGECPPPEVEE